MHRDSLGTAMPIRPGAVNWMTAGRGIVHSERTAADRRDGGEPLHGLQLWVALPMQGRGNGTGFCAHRRQRDIPGLTEDDMTLRVVAGTLHGLRSPVATSWDTMFADVRLKAGATMPLDAEHEERAVYVITGEIEIGGDRHGPERLLVLKPGDRIACARQATRTSSWSAALRWMGRDISGGISCPRAKNASTPPRPTGRPAASISCPATRQSLFRCRIRAGGYDVAPRPFAAPLMPIGTLGALTMLAATAQAQSDLARAYRIIASKTVRRSHPQFRAGDAGLGRLRPGEILACGRS